MIEFGRFRKTTSLLTKEKFLEEHGIPWLLTTSLGEEDGVSFTTAKWVPGSQPTTGPKVLLPIQKIAGRNAFPLMVTLGRALNNDIVIADSRVSSFHAFFRQIGGQWSVFDARSQNGTRVNDGPTLEPEEGAELNTGTVVTLGRSLRLEFLEAEALYDRLKAKA